MLRPKNVFAPSEDNLRLLHKMSLTFSHYRPQRPMYKGLGVREGHQLSLTSPSHFRISSVTLLYYRQNLSVKTQTFLLFLHELFAYRKKY